MIQDRISILGLRPLATERRSPSTPPPETSTEPDPEGVWIRDEDRHEDEGERWTATVGPLHFLIYRDTLEGDLICNSPELNVWWTTKVDVETAKREFVKRVFYKARDRATDAMTAVRALAPEAYAQIGMEDLAELNRRIEELVACKDPTLEAEIQRLEMDAATLIRAHMETRLRPLMVAYEIALGRARQLLETGEKVKDADG